MWERLAVTIALAFNTKVLITAINVGVASSNKFTNLQY